MFDSIVYRVGRRAAFGLLLASAVGLSTAAGAAATDAAEGAAEQIYLDPRTGAVIEAPTPAQKQAARSAASGAGRQRAGGGRSPQRARAWRTPEGVDMLDPAPDSAPERRAVRCPDGSLRLGRAPRATGESARDALCRRTLNGQR